MRSNREYQICKDIAVYLRLQYPDVIFHFDLAGLNLSRAQAGMMKAIQGGRGWPDLFIAKSKMVEFDDDSAIQYSGLFIEVKKEGTLIWKSNHTPTTDHIKEQIDCMNKLESEGYKTDFAKGFDDARKMIDDYLR